VEHAAGSADDAEYYGAGHVTRVDCAQVSYQLDAPNPDPNDAPRVPPQSPLVYPTGELFEVAPEPGAPPLFVLSGLRLGIIARLIEERDGFGHLVGGDHLAFDGWVPSRRWTRERVEFDWERGERADGVDQCPERPAIAKGGPVWVGSDPTGAPA